MRVYHHVYRCDFCDVIFGLHQAHEDQPAVVCPLCSLEGGLEDLGYHEIIEMEE